MKIDHSLDAYCGYCGKRIAHGDDYCSNECCEQANAYKDWAYGDD